MRVKICGITNLDDALAAIDAGADLLGFNFYPKSRRHISPAECARIAAWLVTRRPPVGLVGIFVNSPVNFVVETLDACGLDLAQLSGDEPPEILGSLHGRAFKAIRPRSLEQAHRDAHAYAPLGRTQPSVLLDASHPNLYGGTGQTADWSIARRIAAAYPTLLAGGLTPENVGDAVRLVNPWGVDVASGVESAPGVKDSRKMLDFVRAARVACAVR